jgi:hypothetical protein
MTIIHKNFFRVFNKSKDLDSGAVITAPGGNLFTAPTAPEHCFIAIFVGADLVKNVHAGVE